MGSPSANPEMVSLNYYEVPLSDGKASFDDTRIACEGHP